MTRPICKCSHRSTHLFWTSIVLAVLWGVYRGTKTEILVRAELVKWENTFAQQARRADELFERIQVREDAANQLQNASKDSLAAMEHAMLHWYDKMDRVMRKQKEAR